MGVCERAPSRARVMAKLRTAPRVFTRRCRRRLTVPSQQRESAGPSILLELWTLDADPGPEHGQLLSPSSIKAPDVELRRGESCFGPEEENAGWVWVFVVCGAQSSSSRWGPNPDYHSFPRSQGRKAVVNQ